MTETTHKPFRLFAALAPAVALYGPFIPVPGTPMNLTAVYLTGMIAFCLGYWIIRRKPVLPFGAAGPYALYFTVLMGYALLSLLWVKDARFSLTNTLGIQLGGAALLLVVVAGVRDRRDLLRLLDVLTLCLVLTVALGVYEIFSGNYTFRPDNPELGLKNIYHLYFPYASFHNTNNYSAFLTLMLPFAVYDMFIRLKGWKGVAASLPLCAIGLFTLLNADPRACYIALAVMAAAFLVAFALKKEAARYGRKLLAGAGLGVAALCVLGAVLRGGKLLTELSTLNMGNHSVRERLMLTIAAFRMMGDYHLMGVGAGNYLQLLPYYSASIKPDNLHNMTLQILTEYGILMFIPYVLLLVALAVKFFRYNSGRLREDMLACIGFMGVCAFPITGIAASDATRDLTTWVYIGLLLGSLRVLYPPARRPDRPARRMLFDSFVDFGDFHSGSSVRPQRMEAAFRALGYEVSRLSGLQNRRRERWRRVFAAYRELRRNLPDFAYVEPPSGPFFNLCDHLLLIWLWAKGVPVGLFYRDAYWKFAGWWPVKGIKRRVVAAMQRFDLFVFRHTCRIVFFPTRSMAERFRLPRKGVLPPGGEDRGADPPHPFAGRAVYVGGVSRRYGTDILLRAFEILNEEEHRDLRLTVVCRETAGAEILDGYGGRKWLTVSHVSGGELAPVYQAADLAVFPGRRDVYMDFCMPVKLLEYLSYALPVVVTGCAETAAFVRRYECGIVTGDNARALADGIATLADDRELRERMRANAVRALQSGNLWTDRARQAAAEIPG